MRLVILSTSIINIESVQVDRDVSLQYSRNDLDTHIGGFRLSLGGK